MLIFVGLNVFVLYGLAEDGGCSILVVMFTLGEVARGAYLY